MVDAARHPQVEIISYAEVERVDGYIGNFRVQVTKKPRYVKMDLCTGCGECATVCPIEVPNDFELGLAPRKAIDVPHGQSVPLIYAIDLDHCIHCYQCVTACGKRDAIDFGMEPETLEIEVGSIIMATGFDNFDPTVIPEYGFGRYPNVVTAMEMERLANSSGPTVGKLIRPSDGRPPKSLAIIQCVGSRDKRFNEYCSGFCCMYAIKNATLLKQADPEMDITIYYMDIRTPSKGYEEFYNRAREMGIRFLHGRPSQITEDPETRNLLILAEDQELGEVVESDADMVMLSAAAIPRIDTEQMASAVSRAARAAFQSITSAGDAPPMACSWPGLRRAQGYPRQRGAGQRRRLAGSAGALARHGNRPVIASVNADLCISAQAESAAVRPGCPYGAITVEVGQPAVVTTAKCHGCGGCAASAPTTPSRKITLPTPRWWPNSMLAADRPEERSSPLCATGAPWRR